jgi:hypothetical protein
MLNVIGGINKYRVTALCVVNSQPYPVGEIVESQLTAEVAALMALGALEAIPQPSPAENKAAQGPKKNKLTNG